MVDDKYEQIAEWQKDLFREKSLWEVLRISAPYVGDPKEVRRLVLLGAVGSAATLLCFFFFRDWFTDSEKLRLIVRGVVDFAAPFYVGVFGFVFAGFSIVVSLFNGDVFKVLASHRAKNRPFSELKHIYFTFIYVMAVLLGALVVSFVTYIFNQERGILGVLQSLFDWGASLVAIISIIISVLMFLYSLLMVKSLIWSLYQLVLLSVAEKSKIKDPQK